MKTFNFIMYYSKIIIVSLLILNLAEFILCQETAPKAPVNLIPDTIGTVTKLPSTKIPDNLSVPQGNNFVFLLYASGNQQYRCDATSKQWLNYGVDAMLINDITDQRQHFDPAFEVVQFNISTTPIDGGNYTWSSLLPNDNSQVVAKLLNSTSSTQNDANVPWELTAATFRKEGGRLSNVSYVLKVNTKGGVSPPQAQCGVQFIDGSLSKVTYEAEYWFYEGPLPGTEQPPPPEPSPKPSSDGYSTKTVGLGQLGWIAIVGFVSVGVIFF